MKASRIPGRLAALALGLVAGATLLPACAPLAVGGAALTGTMVAIDRRSSGTQLDDQTIEVRAGNRISEQMGSRTRVNVTSYNRWVLLTGEVMNARDKELVESVVRQVGNVQQVYNELDIANSPSLSEKAEDTLLTGKVKAALVENKQISASAFKVVSERGSVFLMGRVTQKEADIASQLVRTTKGVKRVVRILEIISEEELARIAPKK